MALTGSSILPVMQRSCNVLIYGSGAVGSVFGWRIAQHSHTQVAVVCRSNYEAVKRSGFSLRSVKWGDGQFVPHRVYRSDRFLEDVPNTRFDYVICANKFSHDNGAVLHDLKRVVSPSTTLVSAQNGMDVEVPLRKAFPGNTILSAICNVGCIQPTPGQIYQNAGLSPNAFLIGTYGTSRYGSSIDTARRDVLAMLDSNFASVDDIAKQRWRKLIFNATWNATCAVTNLDTHEALRNANAAQLAMQLSLETCRVARSAGVDLGDDYAESVIELARSSAPITPSTLQDARVGRTMEIDSIWGYLVSRAAANRVDAPVTGLIFEHLNHMNYPRASEKPSQTTWPSAAASRSRKPPIPRPSLPVGFDSPWADPISSLHSSVSVPAVA